MGGGKAWVYSVGDSQRRLDDLGETTAAHNTGCKCGPLGEF